MSYFTDVIRYQMSFAKKAKACLHYMKLKCRFLFHYQIIKHAQLFAHLYFLLYTFDNRWVNSESVSSSIQAIHCCLTDVIPVDGETWSEACTSRFISLANHQLVTIVATGTGCEIPSCH